MSLIELTLVEVNESSEPTVVGKTRIQGANGYVQKEGYTIVFFGGGQITVKETLDDISRLKSSRKNSGV